ncbi:DUF6884 domain-containing protein [Halosolutus halophilus]|uniref:DUF6884 domain-containing protein n=1 Tax=Halosolutus halophilus TaxID=1552990 RepID=UPI002234F90E|nr:DUF6884 domain-containing protein [Halosolutus halophilus]
MRVLIIDQCSNSKSYPENSVAFDASEIDDAGLNALRNRKEAASIPARKLYAGRQQQYVNDAVDSLRANGHNVDRYFISAGFGLVAESEELPPYNVTFADMTADEIESRADTLELTERTRNVISSEPYDIVFFALGSDYYRALILPDALSAVPEETIGVTFNQEEITDQYDNVISIPARTDQAKEYGTIVVALKGIYLKNFADNLAQGSEPTSLEDVRAACLNEPTSQKDLTEF